MVSEAFNVSSEVGIIIVFSFFLLIFLLIREFITWYYKINKAIKVQEERNRILEEILTTLQEK
jgi:multisubunit Na+/H+ antiporter MnhB subunit